MTPITVQSEQQSDVLVLYRLSINQAVPAELGLIVGDLLHNLRSSLDCLSVGLATAIAGRDLTEAAESDCQFPIYLRPGEFDRFFPNHMPISDVRIQRAMRDVQPFRHIERWKSLGIALEDDYAERGRRHPLQMLQRLNTIDKHRRLMPTYWWPKEVSWSSNAPSRWDWRPLAMPPWRDHEVIARLDRADRPGDGNLPPVVHEFSLVLTESDDEREDGLFRREGLEDVMSRLVQQVGFDLGQVIRTFLGGPMRHPVDTE